MDIGYLPPYELLKAGIVISEDGQSITMSRGLFQLLVAAAHGASFDAIWYKRQYPDVAEAIATADVEDELEHFAVAGYEEGRAPAFFEIDEGWYLETYPDIAEAIKSGELQDAETHYNEIGYVEGRASDPVVAEQAERWLNAIAESAETVGAPGLQAEQAATTDETAAIPAGAGA